MKTIASFLLLSFWSLLGCSPGREKIVGIYAAQGYSNTYDTIKIRENGVYERLVFDKNNRLALKMNGTWDYKDDILTMNSFFLNLDRDVVLYPNLLTDTTMQMEALMERGAKGIKFCTGYYDNQNCYQKVSRE